MKKLKKKVSSGMGRGIALSLVISALDECESVGASVINMSFGGPSYNNQVRLKVEEKMENGVILVAAAGNDGGTSNTVNFPAGYDGVFSVAAANELGLYTDFTTFNTDVDVTGPGENVLSLSSGYSNLYSINSGTCAYKDYYLGQTIIIYPDVVLELSHSHHCLTDCLCAQELPWRHPTLLDVLHC